MADSSWIDASCIAELRASTPRRSPNAPHPAPMRLPLVTSHAACKGHAPENTLPGIERALALGADAIEIDVQCTADGVPVLMHDERVDRTTDGTGSVREMPLDVVRALDAGARQFAPEFQGALVPLLAEVIDLTKGKALLQIEMKQPGVEEQIISVVRAADAIDHCEVHSFYPPIVRAARALEPRMAAALLTEGSRVVDWSDFWGLRSHSTRRASASTTPTSPPSARARHSGVPSPS